MAENTTAPMSEEEKNKVWEKIKSLMSGLVEWVKNRHCPKVFEQKLQDINNQLVELQEQGDVQADCLSDVAESLEKVTLMLQGGDIKNASGKVMTAAINQLDLLKNDIDNYIVTHKQLEGALLDAFGKVERDKNGKEIQGGKKVLPPLYEGEGENRKITDKFGIYVDLTKSGVPDIYLKYNNEFAKLSYSEVEKDGVKSRTLRVNEARIFNMSERALLTEATFDRSLSLEEAVTSTLAQNKETVLEARMKKGEKMISEYQSISGTVKDPYKWKNYECAEIDGNYCIRDLETNGMIRFSFDSKEKKFLANYFPQTGADFASEGKGKEVLSIVSTGIGQRADLHAHNNAYKILSTPMAEKFFENSGVAYKQLKEAFDKPIEKTNGETVLPRNLPVFKAMAEEIKKNLEITNHSGYSVQPRSTKSGSEINIKAPNGDLYKLNFRKNGEIKDHIYKPFKEGHYQEKIHLFKSSSKGAKEKVSRVINDENTSGVQKNQMCILYAAIMDAADKTYEKHAQLLYTAIDDNTIQDINLNSNIKKWAEYGLSALDAQNAQRVPDAERLAYTIATEMKNRTGKYPSKDEIKIMTEKYNDIRSEMQDMGGLVNYYTNELKSYNPEKVSIGNVGRVYEHTETEQIAPPAESEYYEPPAIPNGYEWENTVPDDVPVFADYDMQLEAGYDDYSGLDINEAVYLPESEWEKLQITRDNIEDIVKDGDGNVSAVIYGKNGKYYEETDGTNGKLRRELDENESRIYREASPETLSERKIQEMLNKAEREKDEALANSFDGYSDPAFADIANDKPRQDKEELNRKYKPKDNKDYNKRDHYGRD